jgi:hypothetical protein
VIDDRVALWSFHVWHITCIKRGLCLAPDLSGEASGEIMLSRCANVQCSKPFLRLREGKLFLVETERVTKSGESSGPPFVRARRQQRQVEHFWLCDECAARYSLVYDRDRGVALVALRRPVTGAKEPFPASEKAANCS